MVRGLVRAGAYLPRWTDGSRRVRGDDEDLLTMLATAIERVARSEEWGGSPVGMTVVATEEVPDPDTLGSVLGTPVRVTVERDGGASLPDLLRRATERTGPEWVAVVASSADLEPGAPVAPPGEGAAVFLVDDRQGTSALDPSSFDHDLPGSVGPLARAFALAPRRRDKGVWIGDWDADPTRGPRAQERPPRRGPPPFTVSQGAFVPGPRYEESRPSRWRFLADRCEACGRRTFPSRGRCRACGRSDALRAEPLPLDGATVVASTWIGQGGQPTEFDHQVETSGPYGVVLVEVAPDVRVTLMVADARPEEVRVGSPVDTVLRRLYPIEGVWRYGRKAVPAAPASASG